MPGAFGSEGFSSGGGGPLRSTLNAAGLGIVADFLLGEITKPFTHGFVFEIIDLRNPRDALITQSLVINPKRYILTEPFTANLTPTEDDTIVSEENGILIREIILEGTTGLKKRKEDPLGRGMSLGTEASGVDHFKKLRNTFRTYSDLKKDPEQGPFIQMHFHDVTHDDHFVVVPRSFETPRDAATNRVHFIYRITLAAIMPLPPKRKEPKEFEFFGFGDTLKEMTQAVNDARAFWVEGINEIETIRQRVRDPITMFEGAAGSINAATDFIDGVSGLIEVGDEYWKAQEDLAEEVEEILQNDIDGFPTFDEIVAAFDIRHMRHSMLWVDLHPDKFEEGVGAEQSKSYSGSKNMTEQDLEDKTSGAKAGTRTRLALGTDQDAGLDIGSYSSSRERDVQATDTIDTIAARFNVSREAIIALNRLLFPYISTTGAPGTLRPGDPILIPVRQSAGAVRGVQPTDKYLSPADILYGVDMALDRELAETGVMDLKVDTIHGATDVEYVRGVDNVVQGVQILINTELGATDFISDIGIRRMVGIKASLDMVFFAMISLRESILSDPRILTIDSTRVELDGDQLEQVITPILLNERDGVTLAIPFGTVSGE